MTKETEESITNAGLPTTLLQLHPHPLKWLKRNWLKPPYPHFSTKLPEWAYNLSIDEPLHIKRIIMANDEMDNFYNPGRYIMILLLLFPFISLDLYFIINKNILFGQLVTIPFILVVLFTLFYWPFHTLQRARKTLLKMQKEWSKGVIVYTFQHLDTMKKAKEGITLMLSLNPNPTELSTGMPLRTASLNKASGGISPFNEPPAEVRIEGMDL